MAIILISIMSESEWALLLAINHVNDVTCVNDIITDSRKFFEGLTHRCKHKTSCLHSGYEYI